MEKYGIEIVKQIDDALNAGLYDETIVEHLEKIKNVLSSITLPNNKEESDYKNKLTELMLQVSKQEETVLIQLKFCLK